MDELEYTGLMAEAWDALRGDTSDWEDRHLFVDLIHERGEPVLDVGCGTGRLLLDYLGLGIDIDGVEISPDMLSILRAKAEAAGLDVTGRIHEGAMETLALPRTYRTILVPSSSFQLLFSDHQAAAAMTAFFKHLRPGGTLAMPFIRFPGPADETWTREATLSDGSVVRRTSRAWYDPADGFERTDERWDVLRDGVVVRSERKVRAPATRAWSDEAMATLFASAGFVDVESWANFTREPATPADEIVTIVGRRPAAND
jgi:SAM-dependent methyltransferase